MECSLLLQEVQLSFTKSTINVGYSCSVPGEIGDGEREGRSVHSLSESVFRLYGPIFGVK